MKTSDLILKGLTLLFVMLLSMPSVAQTEEYQTFIYTSDNLAEEIKEQQALERGSADRRFLGTLFLAGREAAKGVAAGYVTSFFDLGVNAIGSLITRNSRLKQQWEKTVKEENEYHTPIKTVTEVNDFYKETSFDGAMDPKGMRFDGIGCLRKVGNDTLFYISCHIDRTKLTRIINHSKFELVLDTLIISPFHSNLPNTRLNIPYSFEDRKNYTLSMNIKLISSWMNYMVQLQKDQVLGDFTITIPVDEQVLDNNGFLRYARKKNKLSEYKVLGESFIVPRSYMGSRDENGNYKDSWGTGEYQLSIDLKETCDITDKYRRNWKQDYKRRKNLQKRKGLLTQSWQIVSSQKWDELAQQWVITTLKAPSEIMSKTVIDKLGLVSTQSSAVQNAKVAGTMQQAAQPVPAQQGGDNSNIDFKTQSGQPVKP